MKLTYPVGLLTIDEMMYAGGKESTSNAALYLYTNQYWWGGSPYYFELGSVGENYISFNGSIFMESVTDIYSYTPGLRPVVSLIPTSTITQGDGTATNPYVVE